MSYKQRHPYLMQIVYIIKYRLKIIATENTCDNLMDERELAKYIVDNETISENENIECRR